MYAATVASRPGPSRGTDRSTWRLAARLNRGPLITWAIAFLALGVVFGYFATSINDTLGSDSAVKAILAAGAATPAALIAAFLVTVLSLIGIVAAVPGGCKPCSRSEQKRWRTVTNPSWRRALAVPGTTPAMWSSPLERLLSTS